MERPENQCLEINEKPNEETGLTLLAAAALLVVTFLFLLLSSSVSSDQRK